MLNVRKKSVFVVFDWISVAYKDIKNMEKMLEVMEQNDDIQDVWHNWEQE